MPDQQREHEVVEAYCARMSALERVEWRVVVWPDEENYGMGECDALLERGGKEWAVDHSKLQSFRKQEYDDHLFTRVVAVAEELVESAFPGEYVCLTVEVGAIPPTKGAELQRRAEAFGREVVVALQGVPVTQFGPDSVAQPRKLHLAGAGFSVVAVRERDRLRGCFVRRSAPRDQPDQFV